MRRSEGAVRVVRFVSVSTVQEAVEWFARWWPHHDDPLSCRATVLATAARAHALRRAVVARGQAGRLAGVRFIDPVSLARELLTRAGRPRTPGWEEIRRLRLHHAFDAGALHGQLRYFDGDQLRSGRGYADAFARVIADLEAGGLTPTLARDAVHIVTALDPLAGDRLHDVATVWAAVDHDPSTNRSAAQVLAEAAAMVAQTPDRAEPFGPIAAFLTASPSAVEIQFLAALPDCAIVFIDARPLRTGTQRWRPRRPAPVQLALNLGGQPANGGDENAPLTELDLARRFLFAPSDIVADPLRPRSAGPDGTIDLEEFQSIESEIEAAALWVQEQIAAGTPLEEIALAIPALDPHARLVLDRLVRGSSQVPIYVAGGLPFADSPAGVRIGTLLYALARGLEADATLAVLPALRRSDGEAAQPSLTPSRAAEIVHGAGIVGGSAGDLNGALEWEPRLRQRRDAFQQVLATLPEADPSEPEKRRHLHTRRQFAEWLRDVESLLPAIGALQELAAAIIEGATLRALWPAIRQFVLTHLRVPPEPANWLGVIEQQIEAVLLDAVADTVTGFAAVAYLVEALQQARVPHGRFGEPRVFVGTLAAAAGIPLRAVRILGLAEGIVPATPHDDPIVPNELRTRIEEALRPRYPHIVITRLEDRVLEDLHAFFRIVSSTGERLALSVSRQWIDRSEREASGVMLEVAAALARRADTTDEGDVPTAARLRSAYYAAGRAARARHARPTLENIPIADGSRWRVPTAWCDDGARRLDRVQAITAAAVGDGLTQSDGAVATTWSAIRAPGLTPERPISASGLTTLLQCPYRFLLRNVLHLDEPEGRPSTDTIDPAAYGSLFHRVAEAFFHTHGAALCAREGSLDDWQARAAVIASEQFDDWRAEYPLRGDDSIARERQRLLRQIAQLVEIEWRLPRRTFVATEWSFGDPHSVRLNVAGGELYVAGQIDRVDQLSPTTLSVRDLKTGRVHDFNEEPLNPARDLQIGLYTLALDASDATQHVSHAAYVHPSAAQEPERAFEHSELKTLRERTQAWLGIARGLLASGTFPRTPLAADCNYCPYRPACGEGAQMRSAAKLAAAELTPEVAAFVALKQQEQGDDG